MARRDANLAGLAALGMLGYKLANSGKQSGEGVPVEDRKANPILPTGDDQYNPDVRYGDIMTDKEPGWESGTASLAAPAAASAKVPVRSLAPAAASANPRKKDTGYTGTGGSGGGRGPKIGEVEAYRQKQYEEAQARAATPEARAERKRKEESQAIENMTGDFLPMGRPLKALGSAAKSARASLVGDAGRLEASTVRRLGSEPGKLTSEPGKLTGPSKQSLVERDRAARANKRVQEREDFNRRSQELGEADLPYKKGGAVKAKSEKAEKPSAKGWGKARGARGAKYY